MVFSTPEEGVILSRGSYFILPKDCAMGIPVVLTRLATAIQKRKEEDSWSYHLFLTRCLVRRGIGEGYRALARLICEGYFSTILTSNTDTTLEAALEEQGWLPPRYEVLAVGQVPNERIAATLEGQESGIRIVKLNDNRSQIGQVPSFLTLPLDIQTGLQHYFNRNIIIVGCMDQEEEGIYAFRSHKEGSIYYVLQTSPPFDDIVVKCLHKQDKQPNDFLVTGTYGGFDKFFSTLETCIKQRAGQSQSHPPSYRNAISTKNVSSSHNHSGELSPALDKKVDPKLGKRQPTSPATTRPLLPLTDALRDAKKPSHTSSRTSADVLLVTVTDAEAQAIFDLFPNRSQRFIDGRIYYDLGFVGTAKTFMAQSTGVGPTQTRICIEAGIEALSPSVVIMVGIAFGLLPEKQKMGDILVSHQIEDYDQQKIGTGPNGQREIHARGDRVRASERLLHRFKVGRHDWPPPPDVHFGLILSGSKLVSHKDFRNELLHVNPEAIGGEMEGASLSEVGNHKHVEWVLVKAICDWGDADKNDVNQKQAADNAASFVIRVVSQEQFVVPH
jgi:nucleoside phosphorylase